MKLGDTETLQNALRFLEWRSTDKLVRDSKLDEKTVKKQLAWLVKNGYAEKKGRAYRLLP